MFKHFLYILLLLFSFEIKANNNIATLDIEMILSKSLAAQDAAKKIKEKLDFYQIEINKKSSELQTEQNDLVKQSEILSQELLEAKQKDFITKIQTLENEVNNKKKELDNLYVKAISEIEKHIKEIISDISKKENYNLILSNNDIIYSYNITDLTEKVLLELNKKIKKITIPSE
jgi:outer membrane protein